MGRVIPKNDREHLEAFVRENVAEGTTVHTDEHAGYFRLNKFGYVHRHTSHWDREYVRGDVHTNSIEGFWGNFKTGLRGVYKHCGPAYL